MNVNGNTCNLPFYQPALLPTYVSTRDNELSTFCTRDSKAHHEMYAWAYVSNLIHVEFVAAWSMEKI